MRSGCRIFIRGFIYPTPYLTVYVPEGETMRKTIFFISVLLLSLIMAGCTAPVKPDGSDVSSSDIKEPAEKIVYMCEDADNGYYYEETTSGYELYRQNKSSRDIKLIRSEDYIYNLVLADSMLYFIGSDQNICRVKNTGDDYSVVLQASLLQKYDNEPVWGFCLVDDLLFVQMSFELYRYDLNTKEIKKVCDDARNIGQSGDDVYFSGREGTIFKMNARSGETSALLQPEKAENDNENPKNLYKNFVFVDDVMYYYKRNPDGLYRYRDGKSTLIDENSDINEASLFSYDHKLFYVVRGDNNILMQYDPSDDDVSVAAVFSGYGSGKKIYNGYFYYTDSKGDSQKVLIYAG